MFIAADGRNVVPVKKNKTLIAVAETYDYLMTIPESGRLQIRATAQDGSGEASVYIGKGETLKPLEFLNLTYRKYEADDVYGNENGCTCFKI